MPLPDDNDFGRPRRGQGPGRTWPAAAWRDFLLAVLAGNALYYLALFGLLPSGWQHQPFAFDRGLGLDFVLCLALYALLRWARRRV